MIEHLILAVLTAALSKPVPVRAEGTTETCNGRCILVEEGEAARQKLLTAPRPNLTTIYLAELGSVDGTDLSVMRGECAARAAIHPAATADTRGVLVDFMSIYPFGDHQALVDAQIKETCAASY